MKALFVVLLSAIAVQAQPLPPFPVSSVPRPKVLLSPRAASVPKAKAMFKPASVGYGLPPVIARYVWGLNFFGCDTNDPGCLLYDLTQISTVQTAGVGIRIEFSDVIPANGWATAATFYPPPEDRIAEIAWFLPTWQRPAARFWRASQFTPDSMTPASNRVLAVNPALKGFTAWSRKK